jgi:hypothetical protein
MKTLQVVALGMTFAAASAVAQVAGDDGKAPGKAPSAKSAEAKKSAGPAKVPAGKARAEAPRAPAAAKKPAAAAKPPAPKKATVPAKAPAKPAATSNDPNVRIFRAGDPDAPKVRDRDGKVIPTNPDAYDVSSAVKKK